MKRAFPQIRTLLVSAVLINSAAWGATADKIVYTVKVAISETARAPGSVGGLVPPALREAVRERIIEDQP